MEITIDHLDKLPATAEQIIKLAGDRKVWLFSGQIGAGKTTLIQRICQELGVPDKVTSPTYSLINSYDSNQGLIYHLDLYRLNTLDEAIDIGIEDLLYGDSLCFIEWPDLINPLLPPIVLKINIEIIEDSRRKIILL